MAAPTRWSRGERILLSWTGTMFEYLMPALWMRHHTGTIMEQELRAVVRVQQQHGSRKGVPWGISECGLRGRARWTQRLCRLSESPRWR